MRKWLRLRGKGAALWAAEVAGVLVIGAGTWIVSEPAALILVGGYLILIANLGRGSGGRT